MNLLDLYEDVLSAHKRAVSLEGHPDGRLRPVLHAGWKLRSSAIAKHHRSHTDTASCFAEHRLRTLQLRTKPACHYPWGIPHKLLKPAPRAAVPRSVPAVELDHHRVVRVERDLVFHVAWKLEKRRVAVYRRDEVASPCPSLALAVLSSTRQYPSCALLA
jgi:hypothetical protein